MRSCGTDGDGRKLKVSDWSGLVLKSGYDQVTLPVQEGGGDQEPHKSAVAGKDEKPEESISTWYFSVKYVRYPMNC